MVRTGSSAAAFADTAAVAEAAVAGARTHTRRKRVLGGGLISTRAEHMQESGQVSALAGVGRAGVRVTEKTCTSSENTKHDCRL